MPSPAATGQRRAPPTNGLDSLRKADTGLRSFAVGGNQFGSEMRRSIFKSKIHRATVTQADLDYEGSVTIDEGLMEAANICDYEMVHIWNITRGTRLQTYAIRGERGSGVICINGAAAHLMKPKDMVIIATFAEMEEAEARSFKPTVVLVDAENKPVDKNLVEIPGPARRVTA